MCVCTVPFMKVRVQLSEVDYLLLPHESRGFNSYLQAWWQAPFPSEPSCWLMHCFCKKQLFLHFFWIMSLFQNKYGPGLQEFIFLFWQFSQLGFCMIFLLIHLSLSIWISLGLEGCFDLCGMLMTSSYRDLNWSKNWKHLCNNLRTESQGLGVVYIFVFITYKV